MDRTAKTLDDLNVIAKVTFGGVLHIRTAEEKKGYKGPLFYAHPGDLVISKIRVAQGSLCVVPDELDHLAVSAEYPVYTVDSAKVSADFVRMVIRTSAFKHRVGRLRSGNTTKARIRPAEFEALNIPLPTADQQQALLDTYHAAIKNAEQLEANAALIAQVSQRAFEDALSVAPPPPLPDMPVFIARYRQLERWSHDGALRAILGTAEQVSPWPVGPLGEALLEVRHGCSEGPAKSATTLKVLKISAVTKGKLDLTEFKYLRDSQEARSAFALRAGDILMCRTNGTLQYVGMSSLVAADLADTVFPDKVIRVRPDTSKVVPEFLWRLLQVPAVRRQIEGAARTAVGNYAIGGADIKALRVPMPPLAVQRRLASDVNTAKVKATEMAAEAATVRAKGWAEFERAIFDPGA